MPRCCAVRTIGVKVRPINVQFTTEDGNVIGKERFVTLLRQALENIYEEQFFGDERGFRGALLQELSKELANGVLPTDPIIQQRYQKRLPSHGIRIRPDIIIHVPFERGLTKKRDEGNFVAMELKRRATGKRAKQAFANLSQLKKVLKYPVTIFINVDSEETHAALCPMNIANQTVCFAVHRENGTTIVRTARKRRKNKKVRTHNVVSRVPSARTAEKKKAQSK